MRHIIYLSPQSWRGHWHFYHVLALGLAKTNRVLYVTPPISPLSFLRRIVRRNYSLRRLINNDSLVVAPNLEVYTPLGWPFRKHGLMERLTQSSLISYLRKWTADVDPSSLIIWIYDPAQTFVARAFPSIPSVFWAGDELPIPDESFLKQLRYVFTLSGLVDPEKYPKYAGKIFRMPIAGDFDSYHRVLSIPRRPPPEMAGLPRPIIGYGGQIGSRIDWELIRHLARTFPSWSFAFVGPVVDQCNPADRCHDLSNVYFLGNKDRDVAPHYVREFDVGIIPYVLNWFNLNCNPVKFYNYCAVGKLVVSTDIPALRDFERHVLIARDQVEFGTLLERALLLGAQSDQQLEQVEFARRFSVSELVSKMEAVWTNGEQMGRL